MPLIKGKSEKSFEHNLKAEMEAGKPQGQALAIAYSMKRKAQKKALGGEVIEHEEHKPEHEDEMHYGEPKKVRVAAEHAKSVHHAHGGDVVGRIMAKKYSKGGVVADEGDAIAEDQADQHAREYDYLVEEGGLESTQHDFGDELGDEREEHDRHDIVSRIMHSMGKKDKMPKGYPGV